MCAKRAVLPTLDHFLLSDFEHIYEPSDDTFLLCDAIEQDRELIRSSKPSCVLEIGCGSGCVITFLSMLLRDENILSVNFATDINPHAVESCLRTAKENNVIVEAILTDSFVSGIEDRVNGKVDILLFNPPYVPTPSEEIGGTSIEASWAGGIDGREVIDRLLPQLPGILSPTGVCYMVLVRENKPKDIAKILLTMGLSSEIVIKRQARNEELMIMKISRVPTTITTTI